MRSEMAECRRRRQYSLAIQSTVRCPPAGIGFVRQLSDRKGMTQTCRQLICVVGFFYQPQEPEGALNHIVWAGKSSGPKSLAVTADLPLDHLKGHGCPPSRCDCIDPDT